MLFKCVLLYCLLLKCYAQYAGDRCTKDGQVGSCTNLAHCQSAIEDIRHRRNPKICGFEGADPIVCCLDTAVPTVPSPFQVPVATTTKRINRETTTLYIPPVYDYQELGEKYGECEPIPAEMTSKKTGEKAFDKCIEYQEKYVYPCEKGVALIGEKSRGNHCHHNADELIIGGTDAAQNEFPHMVLLGYGDSIDDVEWLCGGTIISENYILTAGHCIGTNRVGDVKYVVVGALTRADTRNTENIYKVKRIIRHPDFNPPSKYNDIALLELERPIKLSQYVVPACLDVGSTANESRVLATGWGITEYNGQTSETMQKVILEQFSTAECKEHYPEGMRLMKRGFDPQSQTCYGDKSQPKDTCQGDSGGPLQVKSKQVHCMYVVVGITSFGRACGFVSEPAIYTRVAHYVPWIESIVWP